MPQDAFEQAVAEAIDATSNEIFDAPFGKEESTLDETGDRSVETMGEGLEGQVEDEEETEGDEGEEGEGEEGEEAEGEEKPEATAKPDAKAEETTKPNEPEGRVPPGRLREANERARNAEAKLAQFETERTNTRTELDTLKGQLATLTQLLQKQQPQQETKQPAKEADEPPDLFENPKGFLDYSDKRLDARLAPIAQALQSQRLETSFAIARGLNREAFGKAWEAVNKLDPNNADDRSTVQRIWASPDPGDALLTWHKRTETLREVGDDPASYRERVINETREKLAKDPEFRKQLLAELRAEAEGTGNTITTKLPPSLNGTRGSRVAVDTSQLSDDPMAIFDSGFAR